MSRRTSETEAAERTAYVVLSFSRRGWGVGRLFCKCHRARHLQRFLGVSPKRMAVLGIALVHSTRRSHVLDLQAEATAARVLAPYSVRRTGLSFNRPQANSFDPVLPCRRRAGVFPL